MNRERVFVDTGAWLAVTLLDDARHDEAARVFKELLADGARLVTTNHVVGETYTFLARVRDPRLACAFVDRLKGGFALDCVHAGEEAEARAFEWLRKYDDQRFSFVDVVSFAVMTELGIERVLAFDRHFVSAGFVLVPEA